MSKPTLDNKTRNYLTELQYTDDFTVEDVRTIIHERSKSDLSDIDMRVYHSKDLNIGIESGFDGSAIHLYNEDQNINEVYYIFRGTAKFEDIYYNAAGIATASNNDQIEDAGEFFKKVQNKLSTVNQELYGDGHSLGGHLITSLALNTKAFSDVRGLNDAPINVFQMATYDREFNRYLVNHTGEFDTNKIKEETITALARDFYKEQSKVISHTRVKGDPLYSQSFPGKLYIGEQIHYIGDLETRDFPDVGQYPLSNLAKYSPVLTLDKLRYESKVGSLFWLVRETDQRFGSEGVEYVMKNWQDILRRSAARPEGQIALGASGTYLLYTAQQALRSPGILYQSYEVKSNWHLVHNHTLDALISSYNEQHDTKQTIYQVQDVLSGEYVLLNKQDLREFGLRYEHAIEQKYLILQELRAFLHQEIDDLYDEVKRDLNAKMTSLESSPGSIVSTPKRSSGGVLGGSLSDFRTLDRIEFDRSFKPMDEAITNPVNNVINQIENEINHLESFVSSFQATYLEMFATDESIASSIGTYAR
ncbi:hypothetical protein PQ478_11470 [Alkalihalophilus pseudofirmus]|uniref:DUF6792 domain-containing protein n=1 Tax=Alkalihalophilus pseudofirmus TaxID=79885 RepID=UPI00259B7D55|nr:DUF6792 domain-containing protein [Alkalihalophilus pseudofirmus]WEG15159.1 hypothetical protein PQ478_11470 [Alkalihalophilus pseudofirmus]